MRAFLRVVQFASFGMTAASLAVGLCGSNGLTTPQHLSRSVLEQFRGANKYKKEFATQTCDQKNAADISRFGGPGAPPGTYVSNCNGNAGANCVYCDLNGPPPTDQIVGTTQTPNPTGLNQPASRSCGQLYVGRCQTINGVGTCITNGNANGDCADALMYGPQPVPPE